MRVWPVCVCALLLLLVAWGDCSGGASAHDTVAHVEEEQGPLSPCPRALLQVSPEVQKLEVNKALLDNPFEGRVPRSSSNAFVTLLYNDGYALPVFVMVSSLRKTGTQNDIIVMVTPAVSQAVRKGLVELGAFPVEVLPLENPWQGGRVFQNRFSHVLTKLRIWQLTQYRKVVYLDGDIMVYKNIDDLFACPGSFCATFINPCIFNAGVMVFNPSQDTFLDMVEKLPVTESYDGGDQGFLNAYFSDMLSAPLYRGIEDANKRPLSNFYRLPFYFHVDHGFYYPRFKWDMDCMNPRLVEFLGVPFLKPWFWTSYILADLSWEWYKMRMDLPHHLAYLQGSSSHATGLALIPVLGISALIIMALQWPAAAQAFFTDERKSAYGVFRKTFSWVSEQFYMMLGVFWGALCLFLAAYMGMSMVPLTTVPEVAWPCFFLWMCFFFSVLMIPFLWGLSIRGRHGPPSVENTALLSGGEASSRTLRRPPLLITMMAIFGIMLTLSFHLWLLLPSNYPNVFAKVTYFFKANTVVAIVLGGLFVLLSKVWWNSLKSHRH